MKTKRLVSALLCIVMVFGLLATVALPTMAGAGLLKTAKFFTEGNRPSVRELSLLLIGSATAFAVSLLVIHNFI